MVKGSWALPSLHFVFAVCGDKTPLRSALVLAFCLRHGGEQVSPQIINVSLPLTSLSLCPGPNSMAKFKVDQDTSGRYLVTYVPVETGQYDVTIKWNGYEIEGTTG